MKKQIFNTEIPLLLLVIATLFIGSSCGEDTPTEDDDKDVCPTAIYYKINGVEVTHIEADVTAEIWGASNYSVNRKVYDIWTDTSPNLYFHTSASTYLESSNIVANWQTTVGSQLILDNYAISSGLNFQISEEASAIGDRVIVSFYGTLPNGDVITQGRICTTIDTIH